jgi:hypothetical protein
MTLGVRLLIEATSAEKERSAMEPALLPLPAVSRLAELPLR